GNYKVILCERGIRTFETAYRSTLDIGAIPVLRDKTHLPVIVDPSHAAGNWRLVPALALASTAAGADGLIIEVHPNPPTAMSDAAQQLTFKQYAQLSDQVRSICRTVGMTTEGPQDEED
ncbi:MAG: 3-deoxy-7-phosphoheptulonate synthase, partial [Clostridia bacterium]|nr:3-deoxy-7-phosphoheptulonate synthase [Clostridia bacterium]